MAYLVPHHAEKDVVKPCRKSRLVTYDICPPLSQAENVNLDINLQTHMILAFVHLLIL